MDACSGVMIAIETEDLEKKQEWIQRKPVPPAADATAAEVKKYEEEELKYKRELKREAIDQATINKKAIEEFLQHLIFDMSDVVAVIVNEMTFQDQQYIQAMASNIKKYIHNEINKGRTPSKYDTMFVIHNFKACKDIYTFDKLRKDYCEDCFVGEIVTKNVVKQNQGGTKEIKIFENEVTETEGYRMTHLFLGQEKDQDSKEQIYEMADNNSFTIEYLRQVVGNINGVRSDSTLTKLLQSVSDRLLAFYKPEQHGKNEIEARLVYDAESKQLKIRVFDKVQMKTTKVVTKGYSLDLSYGLVYEPKVDIIKTDDLMILMLDVPGIDEFVVPKRKGPRPSPYIIEGSSEYGHVGVYISRDDNTLVIKGQRNLVFNGIGEQNKMTKPPLVQSYENDNLLGQSQEFSVCLGERTFGEFEKKISLGKELQYFTRLNDFLVKDGILQLTFVAPIDD